MRRSRQSQDYSDSIRFWARFRFPLLAVRRAPVTLSRMAASAFPQAIIARKRDGHVLTPDEIAAFIHGVTHGEWADYQAAALLMAIFLRGMTADETSCLTDAMMRSGAIADLAGVPASRSTSILPAESATRFRWSWLRWLPPAGCRYR